MINEVHMISNHWMPFTLLFLTRLLATGRWSAGAAFAIFLLLTELSSVYYTYYFGIAVVLFVVLHAALRCPAAPGAYRKALVLGVLVVVALAPTFLPYLAVRERFGFSRSLSETIFFSTTGNQVVGALLQPVQYVKTRYVEWRTSLVFVGIGTIVLATL